MFLHIYRRRAWPELRDGFQLYRKTYSKQNSNMKFPMTSHPHTIPVRTNAKLIHPVKRNRLETYGQPHQSSIEQIEQRTNTAQHQAYSFVPVSRLFGVVRHKPVIGFKRLQDKDQAHLFPKRQLGLTAFIFRKFNRLDTPKNRELYTVYNTWQFYTQCIILSRNQKP